MSLPLPFVSILVAFDSAREVKLQLDRAARVYLLGVHY